MPSPRYFLNHFMPFTGYPYTGGPTACNLCGSRGVRGGGRERPPAEDPELHRLPPVRPDPHRSDADAGRAGGLLRQRLPGRLPARLRGRPAAGPPQALGPRGRLPRRPPGAQAEAGRPRARFRLRARASSWPRRARRAARRSASSRGGTTPTTPAPITASRCWTMPSDERFPEAHFDVITTRHVLEHLRDPADVMERLSRWLKPDGVLFAAVPDMATTGKPRARALPLRPCPRLRARDLRPHRPPGRPRAASGLPAREHRGGLCQDRRPARRPSPIPASPSAWPWS